MSVGAAIIIATLLVITAWQIDKRRAWRKARRVLLWLALAVVLVGVAAFAYFNWWEPAQEARVREREIVKLRSGTDLPYWDLKLGMSKAEVRYLKGEPTSDEAATATAPEAWRYKQDPLAYWVLWNKSSTVEGILCDSDCEEIGGVGIGTSEAKVRSLLGAPTEDHPPTDKGGKFIAYGPTKHRIVFMLAHSKVEVMGIDSGVRSYSKD